LDARSWSSVSESSSSVGGKWFSDDERHASAFKKEPSVDEKQSSADGL